MCAFFFCKICTMHARTCVGVGVFGYSTSIPVDVAADNSLLCLLHTRAHTYTLSNLRLCVILSSLFGLCFRFFFALFSFRGSNSIPNDFPQRFCFRTSYASLLSLAACGFSWYFFFVRILVFYVCCWHFHCFHNFIFCDRWHNMTNI